jgi:hypothetical protein
MVQREEHEPGKAPACSRRNDKLQSHRFSNIIGVAMNSKYEESPVRNVIPTWSRIHRYVASGRFLRWPADAAESADSHAAHPGLIFRKFDTRNPAVSGPSISRDGEQARPRIFLPWSLSVLPGILVVLLRLLAGAHFKWSNWVYRMLENRTLWHLDSGNGSSRARYFHSCTPRPCFCRKTLDWRDTSGAGFRGSADFTLRRSQRSRATHGLLGRHQLARLLVVKLGIDAVFREQLQM